MTEPQTAALEFDDIQGPVLLPRPLPYFGAYFIVRIDDPAQGRQMLGRLAPQVTSAAAWHSVADTGSMNVALTFQGLKALGVPPGRGAKSFSAGHGRVSRCGRRPRMVSRRWGSLWIFRMVAAMRV